MSNIQYKRILSCECSKYKDISDIPINERLKTTEYWMRGFIYTQNTSRECSCHKLYRLSERYNRLATKLGLPVYEELLKFSYLGNGDSYEKLKNLPDVIDKNKLKNILVFVNGPKNCQKTTSAAKLMYNLIIEDKSVNYVDFVTLIDKFLEKDETFLKELDTDYLIIDNCFSGEVVNYKNTYNSFYNLILKRQKTTIIISGLSKEDLYRNQTLPSYNKDMLDSMFSKIERYNTNLEFTDNTDRILAMSNKDKIDIWSL